MSSKSSLFLTADNEHCYEECNSPHYKDNECKRESFEGYTIVLELSKKNIDIVTNDEDDLILEIKPGSELYKHILKMKE